MSQTRQERGAFRVEEKPGQMLALLWEGPYFAGQNIRELRLDSVRREFSLRGHEPLRAERLRTIPLSSIVSISLTVYRVETAGDLVPLLLRFTYQSAKQAEVRGFIKGADSLDKVKDFLYRLARATKLPDQISAQNAFRTNEALEFGFCSAHQIQPELRLHYDDPKDLIPQVLEPER